MSITLDYLCFFSAHHSNVSHGQHDGQDQLEHGVSISLTQARQREQRDGRDKVDLGENYEVFLFISYHLLSHENEGIEFIGEDLN